jgi:hypothetical protein
MIRGEATRIPQQEVAGGISQLRHRISNRYLGAAYTSPIESTEDSDMWSAFRITPQQCIALKQKHTQD